MAEPLPLEAMSWWGLIEDRAAKTPDSTLLLDDAGRRLSAAQFVDLAEQVATTLQRAGVTAGTRVSWQLPTSIRAVAVMAALAKLGAVQNPIITALREADVDLIAAELAPELLIVPDTFRGFDHAAMASAVAGRHGCQVLVCTAAVSGGPEFAYPGGPTRAAPKPAASEDIRWIFYTSGTTSRPKGVRHTDVSVMAGSNLLVERLGFTSADIAVLPFPVTHIGGPVLLTTALRAGFAIQLVEIFDAEHSPAAIAAAGVTILGSSPSFYPAYLRAQRARGHEPLFPGLRMGLSGGAPNPPGLHHDVRRELGGIGLIDAWGLTECPIVSGCAVDDRDELIAYTAGRPGPGVSVRVVDPDGIDLPAGQEGELRLHAPQLFSGYVDTSLDAVALDEQGYFRTGDLGKIDGQGYLTVTGRLKDVIVRNAENISATEVESVLLQHPAVRDVAVVGLPDARTGERCCAVLVVEPGQESPDLAAVDAFCQGQGMSRHKVPEQLAFVAELPRNSMGKLQKTQIRAPLLAASS